MRLNCVVLAMAGVLVGFGVASAQPADAPTVALIDFENAPAGRILPPPRLGAVAADLMLEQLVSSGRYRVVDGRWLARSAGVRRDAEASLDRLLGHAREAGVDYLIDGSITRFSTETRHRRFGGLGFVGAILPLPFVGAAVSRTTSLMGVSLLVRVIDVRTAEVVTTGMGEGLTSHIGRVIGGIGGVGLGGGSSGTSNAFDALLDRALKHAVQQAAASLASAAPRLARHRGPASEQTALAAARVPTDGPRIDGSVPAPAGTAAVPPPGVSEEVVAPMTELALDEPLP
jgi:curli biogenesis system outer membrane secretion channel CsgG